MKYVKKDSNYLHIFIKKLFYGKNSEVQDWIWKTIFIIIITEICVKVLVLIGEKISI